MFNTYGLPLTSKDLILYALSIGCNQSDPLNRDHFRFTYENDGDFTSFPTLASALGVKNFGDWMSIPGFPKIDLNLTLHGEEENRILKPLTADNKYICEQRFIDFQDKGKMTVAVVEKVFKCATTGEVHVITTDQLVFRGFGGFGYKGTSKSVLGDGKVERPTR